MTLEPTEFATETQLWNAIARQFGQALPLPAGQIVLAEAAAPATKGPSFRIGLGRDLALTFVLQEFPFARLTGVEITLDEVTALPAPLSDGLLLAALDALRTALPPSLASQVILPAAPTTTDPAETWLSVELDLGSGAVARGLIGGKWQDFVQALSRLFPGAAGQAGRMPATLLQDLSTEVAIAIAKLTLPLATARALEPGDVLLAPILQSRRQFRIGAQDVLLGTDDMTDGGAATPGWTVKEIRMTDDTAEADAGSQSLADVPLTLRFVTEDRRIALADLQGLAAGALVPLEVSPLAAGLAVRIQANGVTIGEGHLVQIDDKFAVRVARISSGAR